MVIKKIMGLAVGLGLLLSNTKTHAVICLSGCNNVVNHSFNQTLTTTQNQVGQNFPSSDITVPPRSLYWEIPGRKAVWGVYAGEQIPPAETKQSGWTYQRVDDYVSIALSNGNLYFPFNVNVLTGMDEPYTGVGPSHQANQNVYTTRLRIDKRIITGTYTKKFLLAEHGFCEPYGCRNKEVIITRIYANLNITVPQSCVLNAGQVITIDFGSVSSAAFQSAGMPAKGVPPITRNVSVQCDNIQAGAALTMRLQANKTSGNAIVSNNSDVGFTVMDTAGKTLIPNDLGSVIRFLLSGNQANVGIRVQPVSITGKQPKEGPVTSEAYLRVDFP